MQIAKDTSFAMMLESQLRSHKIYYLPRGGMFFQKGVFFCVQEIVLTRRKTNFITFAKTEILSCSEVDAIFVRLEPPFNEEYLQQTWLLDLAKKDCFIINDPQGIRNANEKLWALRFTDLLPKTLVSRSKAKFLDFLQANKTIIAKPLDGFGGSSIFKLAIGDSNANVALEVLSQNFTKEIMLQEYIAAASKGDKRILLLDGEILGAVLRVQQGAEHRNNFFAGGKPQQTTITARDQVIVQRLKPYLQKEGLYFTGIDIIGEYLIEVNVTSPTCIQEASSFLKENLSSQVIDFVEQRVQKIAKLSI